MKQKRQDRRISALAGLLTTETVPQAIERLRKARALTKILDYEGITQAELEASLQRSLDHEKSLANPKTDQ